MTTRSHTYATKLGALVALFLLSGFASAQSRYATSDNMSGYVHWIDLYDASNRKIDPTAENPKPYSPEKTCGRCHDFDSISHGWHFDATFDDAVHGRPGQPWIWSDERTGTHLPLSYRGWKGTHNPDSLGLTRWQVAAKLGTFMPGGGVGSEASLAETMKGAEEGTGENSDEDSEEIVDRTSITGPLPIDCLMCHHNQGSGYSPFVWSEQIEDENFAYAPTAALGIGTVKGNMTRLKDDFDPTAEDAASKLPKLTYDTRRFRDDGKIFVDLVRKPTNDACYYCHTNTTLDAVQGQRWLHDEDVHVRAGIACADCHRNSINHQSVRGFDGESHPAGLSVASLSCQGCHMGEGSGHKLATDSPDTHAAAGRMGAPRPEHRGLPPLHFDKMTCTACHSGPAVADEVPRMINSIAHHLGKHVKRSGEELPGIIGTVNLPANKAGDENSTDTRYTPHRMFWPSYWGVIENGVVRPLNPEVVYDTVRKPLKVRREFTEELGDASLKLSERRELLGEERARVKPEEWTNEEKKKVEDAERIQRDEQVNSRIAAALAAIESAYPETTAVYVTGGNGFIRESDALIKAMDAKDLGDAAKPYAWPAGHNVRPARQSLGVTGCLECHSEGSNFFDTQLTPVGTLPDQEVTSLSAYELQQPDRIRLSTWNQLFAGRSLFKILGLIALGLTSLVLVSAVAANLGNRMARK